LVSKLFKPLTKAIDVETIIYNDIQEANLTNLGHLRELFPQIKVLSLSEVRILGEISPVKPVPPHPEDLCCLMYTSGTTGAPKGVPLKHRNVVAASTFLSNIIKPLLTPDQSLGSIPSSTNLSVVTIQSCATSPWPTVSSSHSRTAASTGALKWAMGAPERFQIYR